MPSPIANVPDLYYAAWRSRDPARFRATVSPDFILSDPAFPAPLVGVEAALGFVTAAWGAYSDLRIVRVGDPLVDVAGLRVAAGWRLTGTHDGEGVPPGVPATGRRIDVTGVDIFTVVDGLPTELAGHYDVTVLARQLGVTP